MNKVPTLCTNMSYVIHNNECHKGKMLQQYYIAINITINDINKKMDFKIFVLNIWKSFFLHKLPIFKRFLFCVRVYAYVK